MDDRRGGAPHFLPFIPPARTGGPQPVPPVPVIPRYPNCSTEPPAAAPPDVPTSGARAASVPRKSARRRLVWLAATLVMVGLLAPIISAIAPMRMIVVASSSMEPDLPKGSLVMLQDREPEVGDVVVYWSPLGQDNVHRVLSMAERDGTKYYVTGGDANDAADSYAVPDRDVRGVVHGHIPYVGYLWLMSPGFQMGLLGVLIAAYLALTLSDLRPRFRVSWVALAAVACLLMPNALGSLLTKYPSSSHALGIATSPLPMEAGTMGSASIPSGTNSANATAGPPKLWTEIPMYGCSSSTRVSSACNLTVTGLSLTEIPATRTRVVASDYAPAPTFFLEAYAKGPGVGKFLNVLLRNASDAQDLMYTVVELTGATPQLVRSSGFTLSGDKLYTFQTNVTGLSAVIYQVRLVAVQSHATKISTQVMISGADKSASTTAAPSDRTAIWRFDQTPCGSGITAAYFDAVGNVAGVQTGNSEVRLVNVATGATVSTINYGPAETVATHKRNSIAPTDGVQYRVDIKSSSTLIELHLHKAYVVWVQTNPTVACRYVGLNVHSSAGDVSWKVAGYPGRFHMDSEWGGLSGYLEATLQNDGAGTVSARLFDDTASAAVSSSTISHTTSTLTRVRSSVITLNTSNGTYQAQVNVSGAAAVMDMRAAWILVFQPIGKTYDYVLKTRNDVAGSCTWSFHLALSSSSGLSRLTNATVSLRGTSASADQIKVVAGSVTQTSGSDVAVPYGDDLQHVVTTNPSTSGASYLHALLHGSCGGVHSIQNVTYTLA